jgi:hypothetical protein
MSPARLRTDQRVAIALVIVAGLALSWPLNVLDVRATLPFASVATAFDGPPGYPGYGWTRNGVRVDRGEIVTAAGPDHCRWQSATFLTIGWPPGTNATTFASARLYTRDPNGAVDASLRDGLVRHTRLPADATSTGYHYGVLEIFISPTEAEQGIYVVSPADAERWPRNTLGLCA